MSDTAVGQNVVGEIDYLRNGYHFVVFLFCQLEEKFYDLRHEDMTVPGKNDGKKKITMFVIML
jgi:hypothetical protein